VDARDLLGELRSGLAHGDWTAAALEARLRDFVAANGVKLGAVAQPLRAALTGSLASPGIFEVMEVLGLDETLGRIADVAESR
jgi:glutamyl-tRNA synthetase